MHVLATLQRTCCGIVASFLNYLSELQRHSSLLRPEPRKQCSYPLQVAAAAPEGTIRGLVLLNCAGGMNSKVHMAMLSAKIW